MLPAIYLDYAATTPVDPAVLDAMLPHFRENFGNPASIHQWGRNAEKAIESARRTRLSRRCGRVFVLKR